MIDELQVKNLALIQEATLSPSSAMTVLTGETGAGKTALVSACKLLMGSRGGKELIRDGAATCEVSGRFYEDTDRDEDVSVCEEGLVVRRRISADGRSRASLDGQMVSVTELAERVASRIDLCGQHEHQQLLKSTTHRELLDRWAHEELEAPLSAYKEAYRAVADCAQELERIQELSRSSDARLEEAQFTLRQIQSVGVVEGEYEELLLVTERAEHSEALARGAMEADHCLSGDGGALDALAGALSALQSVATYDQALEGSAEALREATFLVEDAAREVARYQEAVEFDPEELASAQERLAAYQGLLRSYGPRVTDVLEKESQAAELVALVEDTDGQVQAAQEKLDRAWERLRECAEALDAVRLQKAPAFAAAVTEVMRTLEMGGAALEVQLERLEESRWAEGGPSSVEFLFRPGVDMQPRPLARIASGGEVSRVMLAIKVVLGAKDPVETLVFDEVDAGVGGSTALALARLLKQLAQDHQVIVVTHLPQIAVVADSHYVVEKTTGTHPQTCLRSVQEEERVREIARILSGDTSPAALTHAQEMLQQASN